MKETIALLAAMLLLAGCIMPGQACDDSNPCTKDTASVFGCAHEPLDGGASGCNAIVPPCRQQMCEAGACVLRNMTQCCGNGACEANEDISNCPADCGASVRLDCDVSSPLVPILLKMQRSLGTEFIACSIINTGAVKRDVILSAEVPGLSEKFSQSLTLEPGVQQIINISPDWKDSFYMIKETSDAAMAFSAESNGVAVASQTRSITISPKEDIYWSVQINGTDVQLYRSLVAWVTPHDQCVSSLISYAKELAPRRSLGGYSGYESITTDERANRTLAQAEAIFYAIKGQGISYVNAPVGLRGSQRVRLPADSLIEKSGNCVEGSVLFASAFEALGMNPALVAVPNHMFVGVETYDGSGRYVFIETTMVGSASFEDAVNEGSGEFNQHKDTDNISVIDVAANRQDITPFSSFETCDFNATCADGTLAGRCSQNKPELCIGTGFVDAASVCGCVTGFQASGDRCYSTILKNETFVLGHGPTDKYYFWSPGYSSQDYITLRYSVRSDQPVQIRVFPSEGDYELYRSGSSYEHYPAYMAENTLSYDQAVIHEGVGGMGIMNQGKADAQVNIIVMRD